MFCTESCEHCINATSSGRILDLRKSPAQVQQESSQMGQQQHQQQFQQQQQKSQLILQQHPCCNLYYGPVPPAEMLLENCDLEPQRVGMCFVTEGPEGLSIDCNVPIPNSFNLDEYNTPLLSFYESSGNNNDVLLDDCTPCCMSQRQSQIPEPTPDSAQSICNEDPLPKPNKQPKLKQGRKRSKPHQQLSSTECSFYPTAYTPSVDMCSQMYTSPPMNVMPDNQLLTYLSSLMAPMQGAATTTSPFPNQNTAPSCCRIEVHSFAPMQQQQHLTQVQQQQQQHLPQFQQQQKFQHQQQQQQQLPQVQQQQHQQQQQQQLLHQQQQQQQHNPIFSQSQPLLRFELPCVLTGFRSSQPCSVQSQPYPPFSLQLLSLPGAISMPCIPQPTLSAASSSSSSQCPPTSSLKPSKPPTSPLASSKFSSASPTVAPKKPILVNKKPAPRCDGKTLYSYARRPPYATANINRISNGNINGNGVGNSNNHGNRNNLMTQGWHCPCCSHCCCHSPMRLNIDQHRRL